MYIDGVILFSLFTIVLIMAMMGYVGLYCYRHIKMESELHKPIGPSANKSSRCENCEKQPQCSNSKALA